MLQFHQFDGFIFLGTRLHKRGKDKLLPDFIVAFHRCRELPAETARIRPSLLKYCLLHFSKEFVAAEMIPRH